MADLAHSDGYHWANRQDSDEERAQGVRTSIVHQYGTGSDPSDDYMLRAALEGTRFFWAKNQHAPQNDLFGVFL